MRTLDGLSGTVVAGFLACVTGALSAGAEAQATETAATVVWFREQEAGIEPYAVRYIVTPRYLRSDDGMDDGDYLLFDRRAYRIYSVVKDTRTVLEIDVAGTPPEKPDTLQFTVEQQADTRAPKIAGAAPLELRLMAGDEVCRSALVAPGFLEPVRAALQEFSRSLAVQQVRTLARTPEDMQTPCFLSNYLYATDFDLARGMLLADWDDSGARRELTGYEADVVVDGALFALPEDYAVIAPPAE